MDPGRTLEHVNGVQEIQKMMTRYCSGRAVKPNKSLEQEVTRQRDVAELKAHVLKTKLLSSKTANDQVQYSPLCSPSTCLHPHSCG